MRTSLSIGNLAVLMVMVLATVTILGTAHVYADPSPNGPGKPGAPGVTCGSPDASMTPGNSLFSPGSPFNPGGIAGGMYNPGSQYDIACFQNTQPHP